MTQSQHQHLETLSEIRSLMERSSRFISLSGLSGVAAGLVALLGAAMVYVYLGISPFDSKSVYYEMARDADKWGMNYITFFLLDASLVVLGAFASGIFFTVRRAKKKGQKIWDALTQRLLINMAIPLASGGLFCLGLFHHDFIGLLAPSTLVFYGLALINASKYTLPDVRFLGISEVVLGIIALFNIGYGLEFWAIGFGILHIVYGTLMYFKYEGMK